MHKPKLLIFASGTATGGGSGFANLVKASRNGTFHADIMGVVSNHADGGVRKLAKELGITFILFSGPWTPEEYQRIAGNSGAEFFALSGWLKLVVGLDLATRFNPRTVFNIHPGPLPDFGGFGMFGHHVHEAVMEAFHRGKITHTEVCMHFIALAKSKDDYDRGPVFFRLKIKINDGDTPETLGTRINKYEHLYQPQITNMVVNGSIKWDGINPNSLKVPTDYTVERFE